jgi:hypothetical protein
MDVAGTHGRHPADNTGEKCQQLTTTALTVTKP